MRDYPLISEVLLLPFSLMTRANYFVKNAACEIKWKTLWDNGIIEEISGLPEKVQSHND